jgi:hypothetical protein
MTWVCNKTKSQCNAPYIFQRKVRKLHAGNAMDQYFNNAFLKPGEDKMDFKKNRWLLYTPVQLFSSNKVRLNTGSFFPFMGKFHSIHTFVERKGILKDQVVYGCKGKWIIFHRL